MEKFDKLNIETLGKIIDQFLTENEVNMLITLPKGSLDAQIQENKPWKRSTVLYFSELHKADS